MPIGLRCRTRETFRPLRLAHIPEPDSPMPYCPIALLPYCPIALLPYFPHGRESPALPYPRGTRSSLALSRGSSTSWLHRRQNVPSPPLLSLPFPSLPSLPLLRAPCSWRQGGAAKGQPCSCRQRESSCRTAVWEHAATPARGHAIEHPTSSGSPRSPQVWTADAFRGRPSTGSN